MMIDTGATIWGNTSQSWGHKLHSLCSYLGSFPPSLARSLIELFTFEGDITMDPFCGRGTVLLESRLLNRFSIASDLNPIAIALTHAKNQSLIYEIIEDRTLQLQNNYDELIYLNEAAVQDDKIKLIFNHRTLAELCYLKKKLLNSTEEVDKFLIGIVLGILHGSEKKDGTSSYASISMPNTFSMSPEYVRKYVAKNNLNRHYRNVFDLILKKIRLIFKSDDFPSSNSGLVLKADARNLSKNNHASNYLNKVDLILTSPPYLDIVNYAKQNWIRTWFVNFDSEIISTDLDDNLTLDNWMNFMFSSLDEMNKFIKPDGVIILVIGDVVRSNSTVISLAQELLRNLYYQSEFSYIGCINDRINASEKTTKIWNDTKGKATETDRILILSKQKPTISFKELEKELKVSMDDKKRLNLSRLSENAKYLAGV